MPALQEMLGRLQSCSNSSIATATAAATVQHKQGENV
jgi:hypothetical protein